MELTRYPPSNFLGCRRLKSRQMSLTQSTARLGESLQLELDWAVTCLSHGRNRSTVHSQALTKCTIQLIGPLPCLAPRRPRYISRCTESCNPILALSCENWRKKKKGKRVGGVYFKFSRSVKSPNAVVSKSLPSNPPGSAACMRSRRLFSFDSRNQSMNMVHTSKRWLAIMLQMPSEYVGLWSVL
jgi:hypothetical protein